MPCKRALPSWASTRSLKTLPDRLGILDELMAPDLKPKLEWNGCLKLAVAWDSEL